MKKLILLFIACLCIVNAYAAYLRNIPMTVNQPDGTVLHCFASGDEFFNYLHDENGYTIMQHPHTGYYVYAEIRDGRLVATNYVAGVYDPVSKGLMPYALISPEEWIARRRAWEVPEVHSPNRDVIPNHGTLNNISIFIRFSDDPELTNTYSSIDNMFNNVSEGAISLRSYFRAASYGAIEIPTTFYPGHNGETIISYQDIYPRSYYQPYNEATNTNGYQDSDESREREFSLLERTVNYINNNYPVPSSLNIDYDNDNNVDNVCFIVKGSVGAWNSLLWPHKWSLYDRSVYINGKRVWTFNFQLADASGYFNTSTMCHEMNHSLGAPDLYHYYHGENLTPVGQWDLMESNATPPQHCGAYMKMKYGHWIDAIPEITQGGTYTLNPISSATPTNVAYKITTQNPNQFYVLEYRDKTSLFESSLPGSGLLIYRIDTSFGGNASYNPDEGIYDEVYLFRPGGSPSSNGNLSNAYFSSNVGRTDFNSTTSAYPFFTDGTLDINFMIYNITEAGNTISFSYGSSSDCEPPTNFYASLVDNDVTLSWNAAANAASYNVYRDGSLIGSTTGTTYYDNNLVYGEYTYFLKSIDSNGLFSTASETCTVTYMPEDAIIVGDGGVTNDYLPSYSYYNYALTQQIYTANELGGAGVITGIAFYNGGAAKTRNYDFYLKSTTKSTFSSNTDWEIVTNADKVFSGSVTMTAQNWTRIDFDSPFVFDGNSNLVLVADDNSGNWTASPHMSCGVFSAPSQTIRIYSDGVNYDPFTPTEYTGTVMDVKNKLLLTKELLTVTASVSPDESGFVSMNSRELVYDFDDGTSQGWTLLKGNSGTSPHNWMHVTHYTPRNYASGNGHNGSDGFMLSESYIYTAEEGQGTPVYPDNYLISPKVRLGGSITFWASDVNDSYGEEHFAVAVSTNGNSNVSDFTQVQEWTLQPNGKAMRTGNTRTIMNGIWYEYTADLSSFSGFGYVAIRHFNCYDMWLLCIDDITIVEGTTGSSLVSGIFNYGESCTVNAIPQSGYHFVNWIENDTVVSSNDSYSFVVTDYRNLVAQFDEGGLIGDGGDATNVNLPSYNYYKYTLSQQIYTPEELGNEGLITSIAFYNGGVEKTRVYDFYMKATEKTSFANATDWETVTSVDKVFSDSVTMVADAWTFITLNAPFYYDGTSNIVLVTDDNTGSYTNSPHMACRVFNADNHALYVRSDGTDYDPSNPSSYSGTVLSVKNQILFTKEAIPTETFSITVSANPANYGTVSGSGEFGFGESCTVTATPADGYSFAYWTQDGEVVSTEASYTFVVTGDRDLVATFMGSLYVTVSVNPVDAGTVSGTGEYAYNQTCTLTAMPAEGYCFMNWTQDGEVVSTAASYSFVVENDVNMVANFVEGYIIGGGDATNVNLPSYNYYKYTLSQQIYTPEELGNEGLITSIAFYNGGVEKTRVYDFYMKATEKTSFANATDWETVTSVDKVFGGTVTMVADTWTFITLNNPFYYDGTSNIVLVADDNTGSYTSSPHMACRVFDADSLALYVRSDGTDYDPTNPSSYNGTVLSVKNQVLFTKEEVSTNLINITVSVDPLEAGTVVGGGVYDFGETCTLMVSVNAGYHFVGWTEDGEVIETNLEYSFNAVRDRNLVATFEEGDLIGDGGTATNTFLPSYSLYNYSLTQQIYTPDEIGMAGTITSIAFYNGGTTKTRVYDMYLALTDKVAFDSINDWIVVTEDNKVFSDTIDMVANEWTIFTLDTPFQYDGTSSLVLIMDDNTGSYSSGMACRVFNAEGNQAIRIYNDNTNYDAMDPMSYNGTLMNVKNQIVLGISVSRTFTKDIIGYTDGENDRYYLIASPIGEVSPEAVGQMLNDTYDLFGFDQNPSDGLEWRNYKAGSFTNLEPGKGYLYANSNDVMLTFTGSPCSHNGEITLSKQTGENVVFSGWNLVGNPFAQTAYVNMPYYTMNELGTEIISVTGDSVEAMEGIFVIAENDGDILTFSTEAPGKKQRHIALNVSNNSGDIVDRAIVRFDEGRDLLKFMLNEKHTKVYIPIDGEDFAVVNSEDMGVMPVSFKAEKNGNYTLCFSSEEVSFAYLHLIDNMTGVETDLLANPSYSFDARTTDYESRFCLVFATSNSSDDSFGFFNNGSFVINNSGEATLQVIDVNGRILKNESINGCANVNVDAAPGIYMLRLVNGENVKVQKVVVR